MSTFTEMYAAACEAANPIAAAVREATQAGIRAQQLETSTLESGAMPGEFKVMLVYRLGAMASTFTPVLR